MYEFLLKIFNAHIAQDNILIEICHKEYNIRNFRLIRQRCIQVKILQTEQCYTLLHDCN